MKNLRWDDESWIKMYTRDPAEFLALSFDASGLLMHLWRKVDKSGVFAVGDVDRAEVPELLALTFRIDASRMDAALAELLRRKFVVVAERDGQQVVVVPDFEPAQSARATDRVRQQEKRKRDRDAAISSAKPTSSSRAVTPCHAPSRIEEKRVERREEKRTSAYAEGVQGEQVPAPRTDPTPTLRKQQFDEVVWKALASESLEGSTPEVQSQPAKTPWQEQTKQEAPAARPGNAREAPSVVVVDPRPVQTPIPPTTGAPRGKERVVTRPTLPGLFEGSATPPKSKAKGKGKGQGAESKGEPCPVDFVANDGLYEFGRTLGLQKKHVDYFIEEMRDHAAQNGRLQIDWYATARTWMRNGVKYNHGRPPEIPEPLPPPRPVPPPPPLHPLVAAGAERARLEMEAMEANGGKFDFSKIFERVGRPFGTPEEMEARLMEGC